MGNQNEIPMNPAFVKQLFWCYQLGGPNELHSLKRKSPSIALPEAIIEELLYNYSLPSMSALKKLLDPLKKQGLLIFDELLRLIDESRPNASGATPGEPAYKDLLLSGIRKILSRHLTISALGALRYAASLGPQTTATPSVNEKFSIPIKSRNAEDLIAASQFCKALYLIIFRLMQEPLLDKPLLTTKAPGYYMFSTEHKSKTGKLYEFSQDTTQRNRDPFLQYYTLELMPSPGAQPSAGIVYVALQGNGALQYCVRNEYGAVIKGLIEAKDLDKNLAKGLSMMPKINDLYQFRKIREPLLNVLSKRGHIHVIKDYYQPHGTLSATLEYMFKPENPFTKQRMADLILGFLRDFRLHLEIDENPTLIPEYLSTALKTSRVQTVVYCLKKAPELLHKPYNNQTRLALTCSLGNQALVVKLVELGANINSANPDTGDTPLLIAVRLAIQTNDFSVVEYLDQFVSTDWNKRNLAGEGPFHLLYTLGHPWLKHRKLTERVEDPEQLRLGTHAPLRRAMK